MGHSRPLFLYFRLFNTIDSKQMLDKSLPMPGFEPRISGVKGDRSTTELQPLPQSDYSCSISFDDWTREHSLIVKGRVIVQLVSS